MTIREDDFADPGMRQKYSSIYERMTKVSDPTEGSVRATCKRMTNEEAESTARQIPELFFMIAQDRLDRAASGEQV
jgi:hypothetical protein